MAINLASKYSNKIQTACVKESLLAGRLSNDYEFAGVKTVKIYTPMTVPMADYTKDGTNRYGTPVEMQDMVQELTMSQDKSFSVTIDKGNNEDQMGVKAAGKMLALQVKERQVPAQDKHGFAQLALKAGTIAGSNEALTAANIADRISEGSIVLDDAEFPEDGRTLYISSKYYKMLSHCDLFTKCDEVMNKAITKGQIGSYDNMVVVKVPAGRWPEGVNFIIVHKSAGCAPVKLADSKVHIDPPGISGNLLEGRFRYDLFVFGAKAAGVYADVDTSAVTVMAAPTIAADGAVTGSGTVWYTTDGTDPRYSATAKVGSPSGAASGTVVKAYQVTEGQYPSPVAEKTIA